MFLVSLFSHFYANSDFSVIMVRWQWEICDFPNCTISSVFLLILTCIMCFENDLKGRLFWYNDHVEQTHTLEMIELQNCILLWHLTLQIRNCSILCLILLHAIISTCLFPCLFIWWFATLWRSLLGSMEGNPLFYLFFTFRPTFSRSDLERIPSV